MSFTEYPRVVRHGPLSGELNINKLQKTWCRTFHLNRKFGTNALFNRLICKCLDTLSVPNLPFPQRLYLFYRKPRTFHYDIL